MRIVKLTLIGLIGVCAMSGCVKPQVESEKTIVDVFASQTPEQSKDQIVKEEEIRVTKEMRHQQLAELMADSPENNISIQERQDEKYICAIDYESNHLVILDENNTVVLDTKLVSPVDEELNLTFYAWADEKDWLWLVHNRTYQVKDFLQVDFVTGDVAYFLQNYDFAGDFALEPNTGDLCFSDAPVILDVDERKAFLDAEQEVTLSLVNLFTKAQPQIIEKAISRSFSPRWVEPYHLTYNNPYLGIDEIEKVHYVYNQSYGLAPATADPVIYETDEMYKEKIGTIIEEIQASSGKSDKTITLYGYTIPIKDITVWQDDNSPWINEGGYIRCIPDSQDLRLHLCVDDRQAKDNEVLANFFRMKYDEETVKWLMEKFKGERDSYITFKDESYIRFSMTTAGFKMISIGKL